VITDALHYSNTTLDENQQAVQEAFAAFFAKHSTTAVVRAAAPLGFDAELWSRLLEMGAAAMGLPAEQGGDDATMVDLALVGEQWGRTIAPVPLAGHVATTRLLGRTGAPAELLGAAASGNRIFTLALAPAVPAVPQLVADAAIAADVIALVGDELLACRTPTPGALVPNQGGTPLAWWDVQDATARVTLATGPHAVAAYEGAVSEWKVLTAAALVGIADAALALAVEFAKTRETLGVPIGSLQGVAFPLADIAIEIAGARTLVHKAAWTMHHRPGSRPELPLMAFDVARRTAKLGTTTSVHVQGGLGFTDEADTSLYFLRAKGWSALAGDPSADLKRIGAGVVASVADV
jgi:alkylation response protein AidB-like acyl-CoA dehydrogenase